MLSPLEEGVLRAIASHAKRCIEYVEDLHEEAHPDAVHDEFAVTRRLDHGRIVGNIDHLAVAGGTYHVADSKTSDLARNAVADLSEHYLPQLEAYATAIYQADDVLDTIVLHQLFTEGGEPQTWTYEPGKLEEKLGKYDDTLRRAAEGSGPGR